jgi:hypothetical protein
VAFFKRTLIAMATMAGLCGLLLVVTGSEIAAGLITGFVALQIDWDYWI